MRVVTIVSLGGCALFGLAALVVAKTMLPNPGTAKAAPAPVVGVPVVVAKAPMKFGDKLDASKVEVLQMPANAVPDGAFKTTAQVLAQDGGGPPVALTAIAAREPLLPAKLSGPGARASIAAEIADGMRAYTIKVTDVTGVGGHALPGDRVDVVLMRDLSTDANSSKHNFVSEVVIQDVRVLGVDLNADPASNKPATPSTATLEVSVPDAEKLAVAGDLGKLSLALRKTGSAEIAKTEPMHANFVSGGGAPRVSHAVARHPAGVPAAPAAAPLILIVEGDGKGGDHAHKRAPKPASPPSAPVAAAVAQQTANAASAGAGQSLGSGMSHPS
ncbi:Flp pilus assembly protein CpaB [Phenylobacterium sp.]|uniref:Flp pilus assembly protein CpaB n=1 Tax=Phenylobacterium sp. TaxID=1871053 RepID=UPI0012115BE5|nr:Flp pilus assembly protein CpaB [Phenylobacterium sp.]THD58547.1 MAG: Flp pilus assembly protein CpaB [Phenylobacterium sp.]